MLAGAILGARKGFLSVLLFLVLVAAGLPLLSGGRGGLGVFVGPSVGYLAGWLLGVVVIGWFTARLLPRYRVLPALGATALGGIVAVYLVGVPVFAAITGTPLDVAVPRLARVPARRPRQGRRHRARREGRAPRMAGPHRPAAVAVAARCGGVHRAHERLAARLVATTPPSRSAGVVVRYGELARAVGRRAAPSRRWARRMPRAAPIPSPSSSPCSPHSTTGGPCSSALTSRRPTDSRAPAERHGARPDHLGLIGAGRLGSRGRPHERLVARVVGSPRRAHGPRRRRPHRGDRPAARVDAPLRGAARPVARRVGRRRPRRRDRRARDADPARAPARRRRRCRPSGSSPGAASSDQLRRRAAARGIRVTEYYGAAELSFVAAGRDGAARPVPRRGGPAAAGRERRRALGPIALPRARRRRRRDAAPRRRGLRHRRRPGRTRRPTAGCASSVAATPPSRPRGPPCWPSTSSPGSCRSPASRARPCSASRTSSSGSGVARGRRARRRRRARARRDGGPRRALAGRAPPALVRHAPCRAPTPARSPAASLRDALASGGLRDGYPAAFERSSS